MQEMLVLLGNVEEKFFRDRNIQYIRPIIPSDDEVEAIENCIGFDGSGNAEHVLYVKPQGEGEEKKTFLASIPKTLGFPREQVIKELVATAGLSGKEAFAVWTFSHAFPQTVISLYEYHCQKSLHKKVIRTHKPLHINLTP